MLDEARFRGKEVPGPIYNINPKHVTPKAPHMQMYPKVRQKGQQIKGSRCGSHAVLQKKKEPGPGTYDGDKVIDSKKENKIEWKFSQGKRITIFEQAMLKKKSIPGVGQYVNKEKSFDRLSSPPI